MTFNKEINYLNKDFNDFKNNLINYSKTYFPNTYNDFTDANPGSLFIDLASYIGDVSKFYLDNQIQENFLLYAKEKENLYAISYMFGYCPKTSYASVVDIDIYQLIPAMSSGSNRVPNYNYSLIVPENTTLTSTSTGTKFITTEIVDFRTIRDSNGSIISDEISFVDSNFFLLKKTVKAISAEIKSTTLSFSSGPQKYQIANINDDNILQILDATDDSNNRWYEVPYLAQSTILSTLNNPNSGSDGVPYLLNYQKVPRRFVSRFLSDNTLQLEFGAGISITEDINIIPNPDNIQLGLVPGISNLLNNYNKASVMFTREYGLAPSQNITVRYLVGGGIRSNVPSNDLNTIDKSGIYFPSGVTGGTANQILDSIACNNPNPSSGGRGGDEIEEIRNNALYSYQSQLRAVTKEDYMVRALSLPPSYGSIAKVYVTQDLSKEIFPTISINKSNENNPLSLDMYILAFDSNKKLTRAANTLKNNLSLYIDKFRMITDSVNIKDAFYINIGVNFDIKIQRGFNSNDVISNCIIKLKEFFNINNWNINQPIVLSDINSILLKVNGVLSVDKIEIVNKQDNTGLTYSEYAYDIEGATKQGNIYPSLDPSIFEVRYPDIDIQGRVVI